MKRYFIQYQSENEVGAYEYLKESTSQQIFTFKKVKNDIIGARCFLLVGDTSKPTKFNLASYFEIDGKRVDGDETIFSGPMLRAFDRNEQPLNDVPGFKEFQKRMANFSLGFSEITATPFLNTLLELVGDAKATEAEWSDKEFEATVKAYIELRSQITQGKQPVKKDFYQRLQTEFPHRSAKSFEFRMQNISYVFSLMGRDWISGLRPASHIGRRGLEKITSCINALEGASSIHQVAFEATVDSTLEQKEIDLPNGTEVPVRTIVETSVYDRSPEVKAWVIKSANGVCECCHNPSPFKLDSGRPFLEVHHVIRLAEGGADKTSNAVAVCPNCHRELHYGENRKALADGLYSRVDRLRK